MHLARTAARYFDYADVVEAHHETKIDSPSGTALSIARAIVEGHGGKLKSNVPEKATLAGTCWRRFGRRKCSLHPDAGTAGPS